jgi:hypothetical protein
VAPCVLIVKKSRRKKDALVYGKAQVLSFRMAARNPRPLTFIARHEISLPLSFWMPAGNPRFFTFVGQDKPISRALYDRSRGRRFA